MDLRKIKTLGLEVDKSKIFVHPLTLEIINHENKICPSKFFIDKNNKINYNKINNCTQLSKSDINKYMLYPSTIINSSQL